MDRTSERLAVVAGGVIGTLLRAGVAEIVDVAAFPAATFAVNVLGSFLLGFVVVRLRHVAGWPLAAPLLATGVLGSFTTFSAFAVDVVSLARSGDVPLAVLYGVGSVTAGVAVALLGERLAHARRPSGTA